MRREVGDLIITVLKMINEDIIVMSFWDHLRLALTRCFRSCAHRC